MQKSVAVFLGGLILVACGSSGSTDGGVDAGADAGVDAGFINITFTSVDVHPAAKAWAATAHWPVPDLNLSNSELLVNGVALDLASATSRLTVFATQPISATSSYTFQVSNSDIAANGYLGVLAGVQLVPSSDAGVASLPQPTCAQFAQLQGLVSAIAADGGSSTTIAAALAGNSPPFSDYFVPTGSIVGTGIASPPTADVTNAVAYGVPLSFAVALNCAGADNANKTTRDTDLGVALVYDTSGSAPGVGTPVSGATFSVSGSGNSAAVPTYYAANFTATAAATDSTGVAAIVNVPPGATGFAKLTVTGETTRYYNLATQPNSIFNVLVFSH